MLDTCFWHQFDHGALPAILPSQWHLDGWSSSWCWKEVVRLEGFVFVEFAFVQFVPPLRRRSLSSVDCQVGLGSTSGAGDREGAREFSRDSWRPLAAPRAPFAPGDTGGLFVNVTLVEFAPPLRSRGLLVGYHVRLGRPSALETQRMLEICISSSCPLFVDVAFGKFGDDYFAGVSGPESRQTFGCSRFRRGGSQDRPDTPASWALKPMLTRGDSHPCELGTHTHALFCSRVAFL